MELTLERLKEVLNYNPKTGVFTWLKKTANRANRTEIGGIAGSMREDGRVSISIDGRRYYAYRLAWFYTTGQWPKHQIDHRNRDASVGALENLREATNAENMQNTKIYSTNRTGYPGVSWDKTIGKYSATIMKDYVKYTFGYFDTAEEANTARIKGKAELHIFNPETNYE